jgi:hypothetical protein
MEPNRTIVARAYFEDIKVLNIAVMMKLLIISVTRNKKTA